MYVMNQNLKKYFAEFIGTFALTFAGTAAIVTNAKTGVLGGVGIALVFGFIVAVMVYSIGHISGAHINPAVTIALWLGRKFNKKDVAPYIIAQLLGACLASLLVLNILGNNLSIGATLPKDGNYIQSFFLEIVMTFFLMFVILSCAIGKMEYKQFAGWAIGTTIAIDALFGGAISGASMNPARSFGPALVSGNFSYHWIYWIAPITGAILALIIYRLIEPNSKK